MKIQWLDAYSSENASLKTVIEELGVCGLSEAHGEIVYKDSNWIVIRYLHYPNLKDQDEFLIIPASCLLTSKKKRRKK